MNYEENRLRSFEKWPSTAGIDPRKIAKAGFYYMGQGVEVQCFCCGARISDWNYEDKVVAVITRHKMLDPGCPFIKNSQASGNVPISSTNNSRRVSECSQSSRVSGSSPESTQNNEGDSSRRPEVSSRTSSSISFSDDRFLSRNRGNRRRDEYSNETDRLQSFTGWPLRFITPQQLAKAGFYYTGHSDKVECYNCGLGLENWEEGDSPLEEHRRGEPNCQFIISIDCGVHVRSTVTDSTPFNGEYEHLSNIGVHKHRIPRSPKYSTYESRLKTYKNWPPSIPQTPHQLSDAGFYFTGRGDQVRCFHCDGGLKLWEGNDDPWEEHARWFPDCGFLFLTRGQSFIDQMNFSYVSDKQKQHQTSAVRNEGRGVKRKQHVKVRTVSDDELQTLMSSPHALAALEVGLEVYRVKLALKQKIEYSGEEFCRAEDLISAAFSVQADEDSEADDVWGTPPNSPAIFGKTRVSPRRDCLGRQNSNHRVSPARNISSSPSVSNRDNQNVDRENNQYITPSSSSESVTDERNGSIISVKTASNNVRDKSCDRVSSPNKLKTMYELEEEVKRLKEWRQCKVCMDNEVGVVLLPCCHLVTCSVCTQSLIDCPLCRQSIQAVVRTFLS